jgi:xanthine/CO dehydrogenase XdhC/CoxF family maturation factor
VAAVTRWLDRDGANQLEEVPVPDGTHDLGQAVEITAAAVLAEVIPFLREAG